MPAPVRNQSGEYLTIESVMKRINLCRSSVVKLSKESNSLFRYGKVFRVHWPRFKEHFESNYNALTQGNLEV